MRFKGIRFSHRSIFLASILVTQIICLLAAITIFDYWLRHQIVGAIQERMQRNADKLADEMSKTISLLNIDNIAPNSKGRNTLAELLNSLDIPGVAYTVVFTLNTHELIGLNQEDMTSSQIREIKQIALEYARSENMTYTHPDFVTVIREIPTYDAILIVFQDERYIESRLEQITGRIKLIGTIIIIVLISASAFFTLFIFSRYESELDTINSSLEEKVKQRSKALVRSRDAVIFGLAKLAESRDDQTGQHIERICHYVKLLAEHLVNNQNMICGLDLDFFSQTAALHDIGKVAIPDAILLKPGKLTHHERELIQQHAGIGGDTLMAIKHKWGDDPFLVTASQIAYAHHEHWDGNGYPFGLSGEDIPLAARIVAVADVYDALRTTRPYKTTFTHEQTVDYIRQNSGTQFDPRIVNIFLQHEKEFKEISETVLDEFDSIEKPDAGHS